MLVFAKHTIRAEEVTEDTRMGWTSKCVGCVPRKEDESLVLAFVYVKKKKYPNYY
jgi:hypothetical protein